MHGLGILSLCILRSLWIVVIRQLWKRKLTVKAGVGAAQGRDRRVRAGHDELVVGAPVVARFRRRQHEVLEVQPENVRKIFFKLEPIS